MGLQPQKTRKIAIFLYKFTPKGKFWGSTEKVEYRYTTTNLPVCNDTINIVLKIRLFHNVSVITNFVIPKRDKQTNRQKTSHFFVYSRRATQDPHHTWHGDRAGPYHFCTPLTVLDPISSFAARGYWKFGTFLRQVKRVLTPTVRLSPWIVRYSTDLGRCDRAI